MTIDSYSLFKKDCTKKSKYILEQFSGTYEPLHVEAKRSGEIVLYVSNKPTRPRFDGRINPSLELSGAGGLHISGLFIPDPNRPDIGYGDVKGTNDALLWILTECQIELFVFKGKKPVINNLFSMLFDNDTDLEAEMEACRQKAKMHVATNK